MMVSPSNISPFYNLNVGNQESTSEEFSLNIDDLILVDSKDVGTKEGGIYEDKSGTKWYVKVTEDLHVPEFLTSRMLQYLVPRNISPVYFIKGKPGWVASKEIKGFQTQIDVVSRGKIIQDEVKLTIALDFVRYIDRIRGNLGYIIDEEDPRNLIAACVDYDLGFRFFWSEDHKTVQISLTNLNQLQEAIEIFESYTTLPINDLLVYVDTLVSEAEKNKGVKNQFDLSTFREIIQTRLEKMKDIMWAAKELNSYIMKPEIIDTERLKELDAYTNALFKDKPTLLHMAASSGRGDLIEALVKSGANLDATDQNHETSLHRSVKADHTDIAVRLLKAGAKPNKMVHERPLHLAIMRDNVTLARELSGSYPHKKWTLVDKALECKSTKIIRELASEWMQDATVEQKNYLKGLM